VAIIDGHSIVAPDNGLITWAWRRRGGGRVYEITWRPEKMSATFHGRDLFAPVAGMLAEGVAIEELAQPIDDPVMLDVAPAAGAQGRVIHIDRFGNAMTNILSEVVESLGARKVKVRGNTIAIKRTYAEVELGERLALIGSSDLLELAVNGGSAASVIGLRISDEVLLI